MTSATISRPRENTADTAASRLRITRGISATWWYTICGIFFFELMLVLLWVTALLGPPARTSTILVILIGGIIWIAATVPLALRYRQHEVGLPDVRWLSVLVPLAVALGYGLVSGLLTGLWVVGVYPLAQSLALLNWPRGIRNRVVIGATLVLVILSVVDWRFAAVTGSSAADIKQWAMPCFFAILLPSMTAVSLWWWDVVVTLDRARAAESRLGATQERLRVATDVHDLQGHHLQVIALQLELTERLIARDLDAALEQLRAARASVDEARQGTRDLALRFRTVPLHDEIANAVDLIRAAGTDVESSLALGSERAPASVLGPVIRETTTNILRHGGGRWAKLSLEHSGDNWRYEVSNDAGNEAAVEPAGSNSLASQLGGSIPAGSGLEGIARRVQEAGGTVEVRRGKQEFAVVILVPGEAA